MRAPGQRQHGYILGAEAYFGCMLAAREARVNRVAETSFAWTRCCDTCEQQSLRVEWLSRLVASDCY